MENDVRTEGMYEYTVRFDTEDTPITVTYDSVYGELPAATMKQVNHALLISLGFAAKSV